MQRLVLENFGGLMKDWRLKGSEDVYTRRGDPRQALRMTKVNPWKNQGYLQPAYQLADMDSGDASAITTSIVAFANKDGPQTGNTENAAYGIGGNKLYKIIGSTYTDLVNNSPSTPTWPHTITGGTAAIDVGGHDVATAYVNIGGTQTYCLLYSFNTSASTGTGQLGRFNITGNENWTVGSSADNAYALSTNGVVSTTGGSFNVPRPICVGPNQIAYIGSGFVIDSVDLATSSAAISLAALDIPKEYEIQSIAFFKDRMFIAAHKKSASILNHTGGVAVFIWDTISPSFSEIIQIPDDICGGLFVDGDDFYFFTGNGNAGQLRMWDGQTFAPVQEINTNIPAHHAICHFRNGIAWADGTASFWAYVENPATKKYELWQAGQASAAVTCIARLNPIDENTLHIAGTSFIKQFNTTYDSGTYNFPVIDLPHRSTIRRIEAHFLPLATGASMNLNYYKNLTSGATTYGTVTFSGDGATTRKVFKERITEVSQLGIELSWNGSAANEVAVERIIIDYETPGIKQNS